jgi:hypothetical protein
VCCCCCCCCSVSYGDQRGGDHHQAPVRLRRCIHQCFPNCRPSSQQAEALHTSRAYNSGGPAYNRLRCCITALPTTCSASLAGVHQQSPAEHQRCQRTWTSARLIEVAVCVPGIVSSSSSSGVSSWAIGFNVLAALQAARLAAAGPLKVTYMLRPLCQ